MKKISIFILLMGFSYLVGSEKEKTIGADTIITSTPLTKGSIFISPNGNKKDCNISNPCNLKIGLKKAKPGDIVFFKGGTYDLSEFSNGQIKLKSGKQDQPIIYESYPNELAVFDGLKKINTYLQIKDFTILRRVEIRNILGVGIKIRGNHNIIEGVNTHHNTSSGIHIFSRNGYKATDDGGSYNLIQNCISHHNSDVNSSSKGNGADGISISNGIKNKIFNNTVYSNSDDGIDAWKSIDTVMKYNISYDNGKGEKGNGIGFKLGGDTNISSPLGKGAISEFNLAYNNRDSGFSANMGKEVKLNHNTSYNNGQYGFVCFRSYNASVTNNIAYKNKKGPFSKSETLQKNNSWQITDITDQDFISLDTTSINFLKPTEISKLKNIGVFSKK